MTKSELRLVRNVIEYQPASNIDRVPNGTRGIYALYKRTRNGRKYDPAHVGMTRGSKTDIEGRPRVHLRNKE